VRRLLIRPGAIGDFIVSLPALKHLATPDTELWCARSNVPLAYFARRVRAIPDTGLDRIEYQPEAALLEALRGFDHIVSWYGAARPEFRALLESINPNVTFHAALPSGMHATRYYARQVGAPEGIAPCLPVPRYPGGFIAIHPGASSPVKTWPRRSFEAVATLLPGPVEWCQEPRFSGLDDLAQWLAGARLYIGNDSGIGHLAAAVGTPALVLFGSTDPGVWRPTGSAAVAIGRFDQTPEEVAGLALGLLSGSNGTSATPGP